MSPMVISVKDFTSPGQPDSAPGIRKAIQKAFDVKATILEFEAGRYLLTSAIEIMTPGIVHDLDSHGIEAKKKCHLVIQNYRGLTLQGTIDSKGDPTTILVGTNDEVNHGFLPAILWCEDNEGLRLKNIGLTREPLFSSSGKVIQKDATSLVVEVLPGEVCREAMGAYCMNRFTGTEPILTGESLTYGGGAGELWHQVGERELSLKSSHVATRIELGDLVSWHQGAQTDFQTYFARCHHLHLENVRTFNSNGFCMLAEDCHGITARRIVFSPDGNRLFTGPRDAWKLFKCHGVIDIDEMTIRGVRMDGQNVHANWLQVKEIISNHEVIVTVPYTSAPLVVGSMVEAWVGRTRTDLNLKHWESLGAFGDGQLYRLTFDDKLPEGSHPSMLLHAHAWQPERYLCRRSIFENIAGAGHLLRCDHAMILDNTYRHLMNSGVLLGAELPGHREGGHADDIVISGNTFDDCGFHKRYEVGGGIGIRSAGFDAPLNQLISITNNTFKNMAVGLDIHHAKEVFISGNRFHSVEKKISLHSASTEAIYFQE